MSTEKELIILKNIVRVGRVSSVDRGKKTARIIFNDKKDADGNPLMSGPLRIIRSISVDARFPEVDDDVLCLFLPNGKGDGFVIGGL